MDRISIHTSLCSNNVFGIVVPDEDGPYDINHQVGGVTCQNYRMIGYWCPLANPRANNGDLIVDLIDELSSANYCLNDDHRSIDEIWSDINESLPFDYDLIEEPTEGVRIIRITNWPEPSMKDFTSFTNNYHEVIGEELVYLIYQNSD